MLYPEFKYRGIKSELADKTRIEPIGMLLGSVMPGSDRELYTSIYRFDQSITKLGSLADVPASQKFYSDYLIFDLDFDQTNGKLEDAYEDTIRLCAGLDKIQAKYHVYFSGSKGFHIYVPSCQFAFAPTSDDGILGRMAKFLGSRFDTFDPSIYNKSRIFRYPNTVNKKSGLFKIPIKDIAGTDLGSITASAKEPADWDHELDLSLSRNPYLFDLYERAKHKVITVIQDTDPKESYGDWGLIKAPKEGDRNNSLYRMCRDFARRAVPERDMNVIAHWWNTNLPNPLRPEEVDTTVRSAYRKGVNELASDNYFSNMYNAKKALASMRNLYQNWEQNIVKTGYQFIDAYTMGFWRGEVVFIISRPGNFKTCLLSNILHGITTTTKKPCIFFSMEMGYDGLSMRHIQKAEKLTQIEVLEGIRDGVAFDKFEEEFANIHVVDLSSLNTDRVLDIIDKFKEEHGEIGAIGFDYLSLFEGCANNTERTARMATELKTRIGKAANCPVFCLVQAKREYEGREGDIEVDKTAGKDSSSIEDSGDYVIGTWGHWSSEPVIDGVTGVQVGTRLGKRLYGRFLKSRKFDFAHYQQDPYFEIVLDRQHMDVKAFKYLPTPLAFNQKKEFRE
jgi:KaiC/GvpD/RAD55 family RecA-like ATPase